ncbi:related to MUC1-Extracellular alpha-1,4-glucan glucosidase [Fusarium proliferatum]|nr:related to MUC1-Extracellular alpha-1,4-glucan glucosidase [Fusarium proliferatum]
MAGSCQQGTVEGPYTAQNVAFDVMCGQGLSGTSSYSSQAAMNAGTIEECMVACANDPSCIAIMWDAIPICYLFTEVTGTYSYYTDIAVRQQPSTSTSVASSTTSSAAATSSAAPQCQAGTYTSSTDNVQFNTACGRYYVGTEISNAVTSDLQDCMDMCASDSTCVAVSLAYSGNVCHLLSHIDYSTPDASWDLGVVSSRPSLTSSTSSADSTSSTDITSSADSTSSAPAATSSSPPACQDGTYSGTINQFTITCDASPNGYQTLSSLGTGYTLETCLQACDVDSQCDGAVFAEQNGYCIVYQGALSATYSSVGSDYIYKMPASSSASSTSSASPSSSLLSTSSISLTSSTTSSSASSTTSSAPLTCAQLGGTYTGASNTIFEVTCGAVLGGSYSTVALVDSFEQCMDLCQIDSTCIGVSFFVSMSRCYTFVEYVGSTVIAVYDLAIISARLPLTSSTFSADSTSTSATSASLTTVASSTETLTPTSSTPTSTSSTSASSDTSSSPTSSMATSSMFTSLTSEFTSSSATSSEFTSSTATLSTTTSLTTTTSTPSTTLSISTTLPTSSEPMFSDATSWSTVESRTQSESQSTFLSTYLSTSVVSASTLNPTTSTSAESSLLSPILTTTTPSSMEISTVATSASTENLSSETSSSESTTVSFSSRGPEASSSSASQTTAETESTEISTQQQTSPATSVSAPESSTSPSLTTSTTSSTPSASPRNIQVLDGYDFVACLRSDEGFPTFTEVATQANMTTEICVDLSAGSIYVGVYEEQVLQQSRVIKLTPIRTCYKADSIDGSEIVEDERCGLRCPGDPTLFCGGTTGGAGRRRAIPSNRLLTLYRQAVSASSSSSASTSFSSSFSSSSSSPPSSGASQASGKRGFSSTSASTAQISYTRSVSSSSISSPATSASSTDPESGSISSTPFPTQPGPIRAIHVTKGVTYTEIVIAETVTTVTYVTINPSQPEVLITTCIPVTLQYTPCNCDHQEYPPVDMTTIISSCDACGYQGQDVVTMVVPVAACETGSGTYNPSGLIEGEAWNHRYPDQIEGHQIYTGNDADAKSQSQPIQGEQNGQGPDYENGSDIEAATEGSGGEAENKQPVHPQSTQGRGNGKGPDYKNGPLSTQAASQGPEEKERKGKTANPLPTQDQHNTDRPGDEKDQSSFAVQTSAEDNTKNGPIVSASKPSSALNPSKSLPPQDRQFSSDSFPIETSVVPAPAPDTSTSPSQLVTVHGHHPAVSTTFATEVDVTKEAEAPDSTYSFSPLGPGESSSIPSLIPSSEACRNQVMYWSMMVVMVGVVLVF